MANQEELVGLIPAAGGGTRLGLPYPKELTPLIRASGYKPAAAFAVDSITRSGAKHTVFVVNETKHQLMAYFGSGQRFGCDFSYVVQEKVNRASSARSPGLADALEAGYHLTRGKTVLFAMADTILRPVNTFDLMLKGSKPTDDFILGLFAVARPEKFGMVRYSADGTVQQIDDKPKQTDLKHAWGCIAWRSRFTEHLHDCVTKREMGDFADIMNTALKEGLTGRAVFHEGGHFADMGTFEEYLETQQWYLAQPE